MRPRQGLEAALVMRRGKHVLLDSSLSRRAVEPLRHLHAFKRPAVMLGAKESRTVWPRHAAEHVEISLSACSLAAAGAPPRLTRRPRQDVDLHHDGRAARAAVPLGPKPTTA